MKKQNNSIWRRIRAWFSPTRIFALILLLAAISVGIVGYLNKYSGLILGYFFGNFLTDFYANIAVDCASVAIAVLVIDGLNEQRETIRLKAQLVREVAVPDNGIALRALEELRVNGWLDEGILKGAILFGANLANADLNECDLGNARLRKADLHKANLNKANLSKVDLEDADLSDARFSFAILKDTTLMGANLQEAHLEYATLDRASAYEANFKGAEIKPEQLITLNSLCYATMPDGNYYDGRFNLPGDLWSAAEFGFDMANPNDVSSFYNVDSNVYIEGQKWALKNDLAPWLRNQSGKLKFHLPKESLLTITGIIKSHYEKRVMVENQVFIITSKTIVSTELKTNCQISVESLRVRDNVHLANRIF